MRTNEERIRLIRKRTAELKQKQKRRKQRMWDGACVAACLLLVVGLGIWMPKQLASGGRQTQSSVGVASLVSGHGALGYILMGLLSFLLGVCVTVLLYRMRNRTKSQDEERDDEL